MTTGSIINVAFPGTTGIRSVGTITELRRVLSNTIATADNMIVDGGAALGDGKGGTFAFDGASTLADDGVATVKPIDIGEDAPGRWRLIEESTTSLRESFITLATDFIRLQNIVLQILPNT